MIVLKNKRKYIFMLICICSVLFGRVLNRILSNYFGDNGSNIAFAIGATAVICAILIAVVMGYYKGAFQLIIMSIPMGVGGVGLYLNNMDMLGFSILLMCVIYPIMIKVTKKSKSIDK